MLSRVQRIGEAPICNGIPEMAPKIFGFCSVLCYRCLFVVVGILSHLALHSLAKPSLFAKMNMGTKLLIAIFFCIPMMADGLVHHMIDSESIKKMKDGVIILNTSRGSLIRQALHHPVKIHLVVWLCVEKADLYHTFSPVKTIIQ